MWDLDQAERIWCNQFDKAKTQCIHVQEGHRPGQVGSLGRVTLGAKDCWLNRNHMFHRNFCPIGQRNGRTFLLTGNIVKIWAAVQDSVILARKKKLNITRAKMDDGSNLVGVEIPRQVTGDLMERLGVSHLS